MDISVIIPTYNRAESLCKTLEALSKQTLEPQQYEIIVVDDGSTDATDKIVSGFAAKNPFVQLRYERHSLNRSVGAARNTGVKAAYSDLLLFTDDDIRPIPNWLEAHIQKHRTENRDVSVTGLVLYPIEWERKSNWIRFANGNYRLNETIKRLETGSLPPNRFAGGNTSLRREVVIKAGMFNEKNHRGEDGALACQLYEMGVNLVFEPKALVYHYAEAIKSIEGTLQSFRRYYENDRMALREKYPWYFKKYGHWFLEPVDLDNDDFRHIVVKRLVQIVARRSVQHSLVKLLRLVDGIPWLYWKSLYQYVMVCEALDAIKCSKKVGK